jgi:hypothetical protein
MKSAEDISSERSSDLFYSSTGIQKIAAVLAIVFAIIALGMTAAWANNHQTDKHYLGGLNWNEQVFNWHPVLMVAGMVLCLICGLVTYRIVPLPKKHQKVIHAIIHAAAIICTITGLSAVVTFNNYTNHNEYGAYFSNLYSIHSFMGLSAIVLYFSNFILGFMHFLLPGVSIELRKAFRPNHVFFGAMTLFVSAMAVQSGIAEEASSCYYEVTSAEWNPAKHYHRLPDGCKLSNGIGIMVLLAVLFCAYALLGPSRDPSTAPAVAESDSIFSKLFM